MHKETFLARSANALDANQIVQLVPGDSRILNMWRVTDEHASVIYSET